jgi:NDP-sugar pyrophosphorylase family protein
MKAMIFAAGLGVRLRPLTDTKPKALVEINGVTLLELVINRLKKTGVNEIIINVHHFAGQIIDFLDKKQRFNIRIEISHENELLDTGGGLQKAGWFFDDGNPFLLHNVDVLTDLDYESMISSHLQSGALVTVAVRRRKTTRYFLFDQSQRLCGWESTDSGEIKMARKTEGDLQNLSFMGIHVISPKIFNLFTEKALFSIIDAYLRLAADEHKIIAYRADRARWIDLGKKENLAEAERMFHDEFFKNKT